MNPGSARLRRWFGMTAALFFATALREAAYFAAGEEASTQRSS